jgi:O-antigen/teichoic acid export membrane protein
MGAYQARTAVNERRRRVIRLGYLLTSAIGSQAVLSGGSFAAGLILIRGTTTAQYGYYILATSALVFAVSLQNAFFNPPLARRLTGLDQAGRSELVGALYREQRRLLPKVGGASALLVMGLWTFHVVDRQTAFLILASIATSLTVLHREYFRMVLYASRRTLPILAADMAYITVLIAGIALSQYTIAPAFFAVTSLGVAAAVSGLMLFRSQRQIEPLRLDGNPHILREIAPVSLWSTVGAAVHWSFSQGYIYLVAGTLDVNAVAAIAATRLPMMPMNLIASGIGALMLPLASNWLHHHGPKALWRRLSLLALGLAFSTIGYFLLLWLARDWIFSEVLKKQFAQRDELLLLWAGIVLLVVIRDQLAYLLAAQGRFRALTSITTVCAAVSLATCYAGMQRFGPPGALVGVLVGELLNLAGIVSLSRRRGAPAASAMA